MEKDLVADAEKDLPILEEDPRDVEPPRMSTARIVILAFIMLFTFFLGVGLSATKLILGRGQWISHSFDPSDRQISE